MRQKESMVINGPSFQGNRATESILDSFSISYIARVGSFSAAAGAAALHKHS